MLNLSLNPESVVEYMAVNRRTLVVNVAFGLYFALGSTVLPWIAYYVANWRFFAYVSALPMMSVFITPWILPESARYDILHQSLIKLFSFIVMILKDAAIIFHIFLVFKCCKQNFIFFATECVIKKFKNS